MKYESEIIASLTPFYTCVFCGQSESEFQVMVEHLVDVHKCKITPRFLDFTFKED